MIFESKHFDTPDELTSFVNEFPEEIKVTSVVPFGGGFELFYEQHTMKGIKVFPFQGGILKMEIDSFPPRHAYPGNYTEEQIDDVEKSKEMCKCQNPLVYINSGKCHSCGLPTR